MNFLMRSTQTAVAEQLPVQESTTEKPQIPKPTASLEALIADDSYPRYSTVEDNDGEADGFGGENASIAAPDAKKDSSIVAKHSDVSEEEGWITIPYSMPLTLLSCIYRFTL